MHLRYASQCQHAVANVTSRSAAWSVTNRSLLHGSPPSLLSSCSGLSPFGAQFLKVDLGAIEDDGCVTLIYSLLVAEGRYLRGAQHLSGSIEGGLHYSRLLEMRIDLPVDIIPCILGYSHH